MSDEIIVCRCEDIKLSEIRSHIEQGAHTTEEIKRRCRCGMGPCQGRLCGTTVTQIVAEARGSAPEGGDYYSIRAPLKPVSIGEISTLG